MWAYKQMEVTCGTFKILMTHFVFSTGCCLNSAAAPASTSAWLTATEISKQHSLWVRAGGYNGLPESLRSRHCSGLQSCSSSNWKFFHDHCLSSKWPVIVEESTITGHSPPPIPLPHPSHRQQGKCDYKYVSWDTTRRMKGSNICAADRNNLCLPCRKLCSDLINPTRTTCTSAVCQMHFVLVESFQKLCLLLFTLDQLSLSVLLTYKPQRSSSRLHLVGWWLCPLMLLFFHSNHVGHFYRQQEFCYYFRPSSSFKSGLNILFYESIDSWENKWLGLISLIIKANQRRMAAVKVHGLFSWCRHGIHLSWKTTNPSVVLYTEYECTWDYLNPSTAVKGRNTQPRAKKLFLPACAWRMCACIYWLILNLSSLCSGHSLSLASIDLHNNNTRCHFNKAMQNLYSGS